jgi:hypothetical protein
MLTNKQLKELYSLSQELYKVVHLHDKEVLGLYGEHKKIVKERLIKELRTKGYIK